MIVVSEHAGEGGHYYTSTGEQVESVKGVKGQQVKPDIRHARKLGLGPGVTTIMSCASAWNLERWKRDQAVLAALTLPREEGESDKSFLARLAADAEAQATEARETGTRIHAAIQRLLGGEEIGPDDPYHPWAVEAGRQARFLGIDSPEVEVGCAHPLGFGTKADICGGGWLVDWKGKDDLTPQTTRLYDEHFMQLAATTQALRATGREVGRWGIGFISRRTPEVVVAEVKRTDLVRGWEMFTALLAYWKAKNRHDPRWGKEST
jgi:hypothetical protein